MSLPSPASTPGKIAVLQTAFLGDVVFTSPLIVALKNAWPASELILVSTPKAAPLAACIPGVNRVVPFDKRGRDRGPGGLQRVARALARPDLVLVPHPSLRSALLARLSGAPMRIGPRSWQTRLLYTHPVDVPEREPFVQRHLSLLQPLGLAGTGTTRLRMEAPAAETEAARALLGTGAHVGLVIGSEWATKRWPAASFARLADLLAARGIRAVLLGAPNEKELAEQVMAAVTRARPLDLVGNTVVESLGLLARMQAVVGGDSGLLHIARALGRPSVLLFGPTDPGGHFFAALVRALRLGLDCQPCDPHGPRICPLGHHDCMRKLAPERVFEVLKGLCPELDEADGAA